VIKGCWCAGYGLSYRCPSFHENFWSKLAVAFLVLQTDKAGLHERQRAELEDGKWELWRQKQPYMQVGLVNVFVSELCLMLVMLSLINFNCKVHRRYLV
jgi:hypothetical protein